MQNVMVIVCNEMDNMKINMLVLLLSCLITWRIILRLVVADLQYFYMQILMLRMRHMTQ